MDEASDARALQLRTYSHAGEWLREVSALLFVFPIVDQLVRDDPGARFDWVVARGSGAFGLLFLVAGLVLGRRSS